MKRVAGIILLIIAFMITAGLQQSVKAQCAQCAATVETNTKEGGKAASGLNKGILTLLVAPYLVVGVAGYIWYKNYRRKNVNLNMRRQKLHMN